MNCILKFPKFLRPFELGPERFLLWSPMIIAAGAYACFSGLTYVTICALIPFLLTKRSIKAIFCALIGFAAAMLRLETASQTKMLKQPIESVKIYGEVLSSEYIWNGVRFVVSTQGFGRLRLIWRGNYDPELIAPGNHISVLAKVIPIKTKASPIAFNFRRHSYFLGISASGVVLRRPKLIERGSGLNHLAKRIRDNINKKLFATFPNDVANVAAALLTGNKAGISDEIRQVFIRSGTAHILAISGLHVSLVGGFIFLLIRLLLCLIPPIVLRFNPKKIAIVFSFFASLLYIIIANGGIPATRAIIMHAIVTCAVLLDKHAFSMRNVAISASVILVVSPEVIFSPGFYMSFFAVASLIYFYETTGFSGRGYVAGIIASSAIASCAVVPFSVYFFNNLTVNNIPTNLIAIPLSGVIIMPALICFALGAHALSYYPIKYGITILIKCAAFFSKWKYSYFLLATPSDLVAQMVCVSMLLIFLSGLSWAGTFGIVASVVLYTIEPRPTVFINRQANVFGIYDGNALYVSSKVKDRSSTDSWMSSMGLDKKHKMIPHGGVFRVKEHSIRLDDGLIFVDNTPIKKSEIIQRSGCMFMKGVIFSEPQKDFIPTKDHPST